MYTEEERAKWRRMFKQWKETGESPWSAGIRKEQPDATTVQRQEPVQPIKRDFVAEATRKHAAEAVGPDTRSQYQREQSQSAKQYANQQYQKAKDNAKRAEGMEQLMKTMSPSTYVEAATGQDLGTAGRLATDAVVFGLPGLVKRGIKSIGSLAKIGKLNGNDYHVSAELTNEPVNIPFEKYKKEAIQGSLEQLFGKNVADKVNRFYQKDVYPRFINQTYSDFATDEVRDLLGYNGLPKGIKLYGYHDPNSVAFGFSGDGNIYMNYAKLGDEQRLFESIIHESEHAQRQLINNSNLFLKPWYKSGYIHVPQNATDEQKIFAKSFPFRGYIDSEQQRLLNNYPLPLQVKGVNINPLKEAGASNRELRAAISEDYGGRLGVDLDAIIDNMSNKELERYINGLNGYTDWIYNNRSINFDGIKNTLKKVPAIATPITILNKYAE